jgi:hypothetical protein
LKNKRVVETRRIDLPSFASLDIEKRVGERPPKSFRRTGREKFFLTA